MGIAMWVTQYGAAPGEHLDEGNLPWAPADGLLTISETPLLHGVDSYDDTVFNRRQCEQVSREVAVLRSQSLDPSQIDMLVELDRLLQQVAPSPHRYLLFNGD